MDLLGVSFKISQLHYHYMTHQHANFPALRGHELCFGVAAEEFVFNKV